MGLELPDAPVPVASYVPIRTAGDLAFLSGQIAMVEGRPIHPGRLGAEVSLEQGREAARRCALQSLAVLRSTLGILDRVEELIHVSVFVASAPGFTDQSKVANGVSDLLIEIFADAGRHARTAVGVTELPLGAPVEVAMVVRISPR